MDHQIAVQNKMAERYLLNELIGKDREDFEEHYFTCQQCADDVKMGATFVANARAVLRDEPGILAQPKDAQPSRNWWQWIWSPAPAYALAAALAVMFLLQQPRVSTSLQPQFLTATELRPATRGTPQVLRVAPDQTTVQLLAGVPAGVAYICTVTNSTGEVVATVETPILQTPQVNLLLPAERVRTGRFTLNVRTREPAGQPFHEQFEFTTQP